MKTIYFFCLFFLVFWETNQSYAINNFVKISDKEAKRYEDKYISDAEAKYQNEKYIEYWFQPINKKEPCKLEGDALVDTDENLQENDFNKNKFAWDGQCKNGYAYGLGREFNLNDGIEFITMYPGGKNKPTRYKTIYNNETIMEGYLKGSNTQGVVTVFSGDGKNTDVSMIFFDMHGSKSLGYTQTPTAGINIYDKTYGNDFSICLFEIMHDESPYKYEYQLVNKKTKEPLDGFGFYVTKQGEVLSHEFKNGKEFRKVILPKSYIERYVKLKNEVENIINPARQARDTAMPFINKYKDNICGNRVNIDFIENSQYYKICDDYKQTKDMY